MPTEEVPPTLSDVDLESEDLKLYFDQIEESYAKTLVVNTFNKYETDRTTNHDYRWNSNDTLYWGWCPPKVWEGTNIARASLPQQLVFDQIESALPSINSAIFAGGGEDWFQSVPELGATPADARQISAALNYSLDHNRGESGMSARSEIEQLANKQLLLYGNGGVVLEWNSEKMQPDIQWIDIRDLYIDFACPTPNIEEARSIIRRRMLSVDEIEAMRDRPGMMIPSKAVLTWLSKNAPYAVGDRTKQIHESFRGVNFNPSSADWSPMPSERKIEVLVYYSKSRIIWVFNRQWVAYNGKNPYGFFPFAIAPCYIVPGRFYAMSIADVQEANQRYIESLMNNHLDELSLILHPPRTMARSNGLTPAQTKWRPGGLYSLDQVDDMAVMNTQTGTVNIFGDIDYITRLAERRTGINSMGMGVPRPGNVNRTKFGVQSQLEGGANRLTGIVRNIEDYMIVPMLKKMYEMFKYHVMSGANVPAVTATSPSVFFVNSDIFQRPVNFKILAASRMQTQQKIASAFPFMAQYLMSGQFMQAIEGTGRTVDFDELLTMLQDATGTGQSYKLVRQMNQQEIKKKQEPPPQLQAEMAKAQQEAQVRLQMGQMKQQSDMAAVQGSLQEAMIAKQPDTGALEMKQQEMQMKAQESQMKMQLQKMLGDMKIQQQQAQMQLDAISKQQELQGKLEEIRMKGESARMDQAAQAAQTAADLQNNQIQARLGISNQQDQHQLKMKQMMESAVTKNFASKVSDNGKEKKETKGPKR